MDTYISSTCDKIQESMLKAYTFGIEDGNHEIYREQNKIRAFTKIIQSLSKLEQDFANESAAVEALECESIANYDQTYKKLLADHQKNNIQGVSRYEYFAKELDDIRAVSLAVSEHPEANPSINIDGADGGILQNFPTITTDPITKQLIGNPVRNKRCNHVYDQESIEDALKINSRLRCPYVGCNVKNVQLTDLIEDRELKRQLMSLRLESESQDIND